MCFFCTFLLLDDIIINVLGGEIMKWMDINYVEGCDKLYSMENGNHSSFY